MTVASWGGSYQEAQSKALFEPVAAGYWHRGQSRRPMAACPTCACRSQTGAVTLDVVASGSGSAARAAEEGPAGEARLFGDRRLDLLPASLHGLLRRRRRVLDRLCVEHRDLWRCRAAELGRFLGRREVPGQAGLSRQGRRCARACADGRRRGAGEMSMLCSTRRRASTGRHRQDPRAEAAYRRVLELRAPSMRS